MNELGLKLQKYLVASYAYYIYNETIMPDTEYDKLARDLLEGWNTFEHIHKHLVTKSDLRAGTLYHLKEKDYPRMVVGAYGEVIKGIKDENGKRKSKG